jgi:peptidylprolyl isomerase
MRTVTNGDMVKVHYTGTLENGETFDSSEGREPLQFQVGSSGIIRGFSDALLGMQVGEEREVTLAPEEAYGPRDEQMVRGIPRTLVGDQFNPVVGMTIGLQMEDGTKVPGNIVEVNDQEIRVDLNPPLAGHTLNFKVQVVDIADGGSPEACGCACTSAGTCSSAGGGGDSGCGCC